MEPKECPKCKCSLESDDVYQYYLDCGYTPENALKCAESYGWSAEKPTRFNRVTGIYDIDRDRTTHWKCPDCAFVWSREYKNTNW